MKPSQYRQRLGRLESQAEAKAKRQVDVEASGRFPISLMQLHGLKPITDAEGRLLTAWMLNNGWRLDPDGELEMDPDFVEGTENWRGHGREVA